MQGQWFSAIDGYKVYLLGNPIIWWGNLVLMGVYLLVRYDEYLFTNIMKKERILKNILRKYNVFIYLGAYNRIRKLGIIKSKKINH